MLKRDFYTSPLIFKTLDQHALAEAQANYDSFRELVWNLLFKVETNDVQKVRIIFRWLTCKNLNTINFKGDQLDAPSKLLNDFKNGKGSYARVFECLARYSGLHVQSVTGWAKGADYRADVPLTVLPPNHSWNAVHVAGSWQLLDCHWATRHEQRDAASEKAIDDYDDFYFLTEPRDMVCSHLPEDSRWQLLTEPWLMGDFEQHVHVRSQFFALGLDLLQQTQGVVYTTKGLGTLTLGFTRPTAFTYKLTYGDERLSKLDDINIGRYVLQEMTLDRLTYYFRAPRAGEYYLTVFARQVADDPPKANLVFKAVCDYKIVSADASSYKAFPYCSDSSYGLDSYVDRYPMMPDTKRGILICPSGLGEVSFAKDAGVRVYARLVRDGLSFSALKQCLTVKDEGGRVTVGVKVKQEGEYGLEVFANDAKQDGELYTHFCQYLCSFVPPPCDFVSLYGRVADRKDLEGSGVESDVDGPDYKPHDASIYTKSVSTKPPSNFTPTPLDSKETSERPPASYSASRQFSTIDVFANVNAHAREVAKASHGNFRELIWHLIYARGIDNELEKLRAIFVYLCSINLNKLNFKKPKKESPEELLMKLKRGDTTYSRVFESLCSYAGLQCHTVPGMAKGVDYQPGMHFDGDQGQHSWNAVKVNGTWQLIDCNWAARRLVGKETAAETVHYELDEYYFLPLPQQLIFTHFPKDPIWQLIQNPIDQDEFERLALIKSSFFKFGLQLVSHKQAVIKANEQVTIEIGCPLAKAKLMRFTFKLMHEDFGENYKGVELSQYGMQQMNNNICQFTVRLPEKGLYRLVIYAKDVSLPSKDGESVFSGVGEYDIVCGKPQAIPTPFPPCAHTSWGPGDSVNKYKLSPRQTSAVVKTTYGAVEIRVAMEEDLRFTGKLKSATDTEVVLAPYLMNRVVGKDAIFVFNAPHVGEFGLEVYANDPAVDGKTLHHVYQYLIQCDEVPDIIEPFPVLSSGYLGPQADFARLGLATSGLSDPYMVVDSGDAQVSIATTRNVRMSSQLLYCGPTGEMIDCSEYILQQSGDKLIAFVLKLAQPGMYKLQLFAAAAEDPSANLPGVYNYLIKCRGTLVNHVPFPKQYGVWKEGCYLFEPLDGHLQPNRPIQSAASSYEHVYFRLEVPGASSVMIVIGEDWIPLKEEQPGLWSGEVLMTEYWGKVRKVSLCASFENPADSYSSVLEYSM
jgi:hypothetical protein